VGAAQFSLPDLRRIVDGAHTAGLPVTAHSHAAAGIEQAIAVGVDGLEHASYLAAGGGPPGLAALMNIAASDEQLADLAASGIPVCPTLGGFTPDLFRTAPPHLRKMLEDAQVTPEQIVETRMTMLTRMRAAGVRFVSGTDAGIAPTKAHGLFANAVIELGQVMTVPEVLATATSAAAAACGLGESKGRLRAGHDADVVVVDGDLSRDLTALRRVREVVVRGGWLGVSEP
jgi:imidazolonepropionase-like amidohydrolase